MKFWIKAAFIAVCLLFIFRYFSEHREELRLIANLTVAQCVSLFIIFIVIQIIGSYKHLIILNNLGLRSITVFDWLKIFIISKFLNFHITQGANVYRSVHLKNTYDFPYTKSIGLITTFSWFELVILLGLTAVMSVIGIPRGSAHDTLSAALFSLTVFFMGAPFIMKYILSKLTLSNDKLVWVHNKLKDLTEHVIEQVRNPRLVGLFFVASATIYALNILTVMVCVPTVDIQLGLPELSVLATTLRLSRLFNLVPGNVGLTEIFCGYVGVYAGNSLGKGILISGLMRVFEYLTIGAWALFLLLRQNTNKVKG